MKHATWCIISRRYDLIAYVNQSLTKETYMKTYSYMIHSIPDEALWPKVDINHVMPPIVKRKPGRPKMLRMREADEP